MDFGIMFFASQSDGGPGGGKYDLVLDAARFADRRGFTAVWTPERHFHEFGGIFPNPALTSAALAMATERVQLRAGSLVSPLHHVVRVAEDWSVVDNLSGGRVAVAFGSGWNINDFIFFPERYGDRTAEMYRQIDTVRRLWRGEAVVQVNSAGKEVAIRVYPRPVQDELPIWVTASGNNDETFRSAGELGASLLTSLIFQDLEQLETRVELYRDSLEAGGFDRYHGKVTLMLHTFLGEELDEVKATVRPHLREYLRSAVRLETSGAKAGGSISGGKKGDDGEISADVMEDLLDVTFERYFEHSSLLGTPESCGERVRRLQDIGVDEVACLIDFGLSDQEVLAGLEHLDVLRGEFARQERAEDPLCWVGQI